MVATINPYGWFHVVDDIALMWAKQFHKPSPKSPCV